MLTAVYVIGVVLAFAVVIACTWGIVKIERRQRQEFFDRYGRWPSSTDYVDGDAFR